MNDKASARGAVSVL